MPSKRYCYLAYIAQIKKDVLTAMNFDQPIMVWIWEYFDDYNSDCDN